MSSFVYRLLTPRPSPLAEVLDRQRAAADADAARNEIKQMAADNERRAFLHQLTGTTAETETKEN